MDAPAWLPDLPPWVPYPYLAWFVVEGVALAVLGLALRDLVGPSSPTAAALGAVVLFVGVSTVVLAGLAYFVLLSIRFYR